MSIATVGPKKYDFQDMVCVEIFLRHIKTAGVELLIEPKAGEDAKLRIPSGTGAETIEIQVKGGKEDVTLSVLADWLVHFEEKKADNTLLERLWDTPETTVVFVATGRCSDQVSLLYKGAGAAWQAHDKKLSIEIGRELLRELGLCAAKLKAAGSDLDVQRAKHLEAFLSQAKVTRLRENLTRVIVLEKTLDDEVRQSCESRMRQLRVPLDRCELLTARLIALIKKAKESKTDVFPDLLQELNTHLPEQVRPRAYVRRGCEDAWVQELSRNNILLLSGAPRVGKTNAGRWVAAEFEGNGYQLKLSSNLEEVERFLLDTAPGERLAVVDDPLGGSYVAADPGRALAKLTELSAKLSPSRKLIVSQVQDRLLQFSHKTGLSDSSLGRFKWHDLGKLDKTFLVELWRDLHNQFSMPDSLFNNVLKALDNGELDIEPGCLMHLAASHYRLSDVADLQQAIRLAREDSKSLALALTDEGFAPLLQALAVATSQDDGCSLQDLKYVLHGDGTDKQYGAASYFGVSYTIGAVHNQPEPEVEQYQSLTFSTENQTLLDRLEQRRIIVETGVERFNFSHPFYRSAAECSAEAPISSMAKRLMDYNSRALFSLSSETSKSAAIAMRWVYLILKLSKRGQNIIDLAIAGLGSRYLATKDACFYFLLHSLDDIPEGQKSGFASWVSAVSFLNLSHVLWERGEAALPPGDNNVIEGRFYDSYEWHEVAAYVAAFSSENAADVSAEHAWKTMCYLEGDRQKLSAPVLLRLLSYDLGLLRAKAAKLWISSVHVGDEDLLQKIFADQHPAVAQAALEGAIQVWPDCTVARRSVLIAGLQRFSMLPASASTMIKVLLKNTDGGYDDPVPRDLLASLLPNLLDAFPEGVNMNDPRLYGAVKKGMTQLPQSDFIRIIDSWIGLVERVASRTMPSDYAMAVTDLLIRGTTTSVGLRPARLQRLFNLKGTGAQLRLVVEMVDSWDQLSTDDRDQFLRHLREDRDDQTWLKAAAVTRSAVPQDVWDLVFPLGNLPTMGNFQSFETEIIERSLMIYMGSPGILYQVAAHRRADNRWESIIETIALDPTHKLFKKAWSHITSGADDSKVSGFVSKLVGHFPQEVFERLLEHKIQNNGGFMPDAWSLLLDQAPGHLLDDWFAAMVPHVPRVLNDLGEAGSWVGNDHAFRLIRLFPADISLLEVSYDLRKMITEGFKDFQAPEHQEIRRQFASEALRQFLENFENNLPKHYATCDAITERFKDIGCVESELFVVEEHRKVLLDRLNESYVYEHEELEDWIA
ncbi:nSTAND3 domain-containing NTPase [Pseudomonas sp. SDT291_1_S447]